MRNASNTLFRLEGCGRVLGRVQTAGIHTPGRMRDAIDMIDSIASRLEKSRRVHMEAGMWRCRAAETALEMVVCPWQRLQSIATADERVLVECRNAQAGWIESAFCK